MKRFFSALLYLAIVVCLAEPRLAQSRGSGKGTGTPAAFDSSVERIPPNFRGANLRSLYKHFAGASLEKGEFETKVAFESRQKAAAQRLGVEVTRFAVVTAEPDEGFSYDAESGVYTLLLGFRRDAVSSITERGPRSRTFYRGTNSFGVSRRVERVVGVDFDVRLQVGDCDIEFPLSPDRARRLKPNLGLLYVVTVASSFEDVASRSPTVEDPSDVEIRVFGVNAHVHEVWLVDRRTGGVVAKMMTCSRGEMAERAWQPIELPTFTMPDDEDFDSSDEAPESEP